MIRSLAALLVAVSGCGPQYIAAPPVEPSYLARPRLPLTYSIDAPANPDDTHCVDWMMTCVRGLAGQIRVALRLVLAHTLIRASSDADVRASFEVLDDSGIVGTGRLPLSMRWRLILRDRSGEPLAFVTETTWGPATGGLEALEQAVVNRLGEVVHDVTACDRMTSVCSLARSR